MSQSTATKSGDAGFFISSWSDHLSRLLNTIANGQVIRIVVGSVVQALTVLVLIAYVIFAVWRVFSILFGEYAKHLMFSEGLGAILAFVFGLLAVITCCLVAWIRGGDIRKMPDQDFTVLAISARLIRMYGEITLVGSLVIGLLALLLTWLDALGMLAMFTLGGGAWLLQSFSLIGNRFIGGIFLMIGVWVYGFALLLLCYLIAEFLSVLFTIAFDMRRIRDVAESSVKGRAVEPI